MCRFVLLLTILGYVPMYTNCKPLRWCIFAVAVFLLLQNVVIIRLSICVHFDLFQTNKSLCYKLNAARMRKILTLYITDIFDLVYNYKYSTYMYNIKYWLLFSNYIINKKNIAIEMKVISINFFFINMYDVYLRLKKHH